MKAKRIISLLLTVAMVVACGVTAFAAPTGYEDYVQSFAGVFAPADKQTPVGDRPSDDLRAELTIVEELTQADFEEAYGELYADLGVESTYNFYQLNISYHNIGGVYKEVPTDRSKYTGWVILGAAMELNFPEDVIYYGADLDFDDATDTEMPSASLGNTSLDIEAGNFKFVFSAPQASGAYPSVTNKVGERTDATEIANAYSFGLFAEPGSVVELTNVNLGYMSYEEGAKTKQLDGTTDFDKEAYAPWHPATVTLGEAAEEGGDDTTVPTVGALTSWGTDGVDILYGDRAGLVYDNAYAVTASFENVGTYTKAGVLFIPAAVLDGADLDLNNTDAKDVAATGIGVSDGGTLTVKAAIKGIPREYNGLTMVAKPYIVVGETPYYGNALEEVISFGNTGEVVE